MSRESFNAMDCWSGRNDSKGRLLAINGKKKSQKIFDPKEEITMIFDGLATL